MRRFPGAALALLLLSAGAAMAGQDGSTKTEAATATATESPVVIELYTSQGCSSCPPADELLGRLASHEGVIALGFHVDYWDYIGWKDDFGSPAYTQRQRDYARAVNSRTIYTPQMIVEGVNRVVGFKPAEVSALIQKYHATPRPAKVTMTRAGDTLTIHATATARFAKPAMVELVRYIPMRRVAIRSGENAGRTMDYHNIVTQLTRIGTWDGAGAYDAKVKIKGDQPAALLIQAPGPGEIYGAALVK